MQFKNREHIFCTSIYMYTMLIAAFTNILELLRSFVHDATNATKIAEQFDEVC